MFTSLVHRELDRISAGLRQSHPGTILRPMRVIAVSTLRAFWERYPDAEQPLKAWYEEATGASWSQPADIKAQYRSASVLKNRRVVFNIKGNDYRLIVAIAYKLQIVYVKFVGTHQEYDAVDAENVEMA
jgi:mRNA interferase HigB